MAVHLHTQLAGSPLTLLIISYECGNVFLFVVFFLGGRGVPMHFDKYISMSI